MAATCSAPPAKPFCPTPAPGGVPPAAKQTGTAAVDWCAADTCARAFDLVTALADQPSGYGAGLGQYKVGDRWIIPGFNDEASSIAFIGWIKDAIAQAIVGATRKLTDIYDSLLPAFPCAGSAELRILSQMIPGTWIQRIFGIDMSNYQRQWEYAANFICPTVLPSPSEADRAWLASEIDDDTWQCWQRIAGHCPEHFSKVRDAGRSRPDPLQMVLLNLRGFWRGAEYEEEMRANGVIYTREREAYEALAKWIPGPSDLIRFMVRDTEDEAVVQFYGYDVDLGKKLSPALLAEFRSQGVSDDDIRRYWRAHWQVPSTGQFFEMLHRLRPELYGVVSSEGLAVDQQFIASALQINDMAPAFIDRMIEISYRPLTRIDANRAYDVGVLDNAGLSGAYQDVGYKKEDAETLVEFRKRQRELQQRRAGSPEKPATIVRGYMDGWLTSGLVRLRLKEWYFSDEVIDKIITDADQAVILRRNREVIAAVKRKYLRSSMTQAEAINVMANAGVEVNYAMAEAQHWQTIWGLRDRELSAAQLCKLFTQRLITADDYVSRLIRLGYSETDANLSAGSCNLNLLEKLLKEAESAAQRAQNAAAKQAQQALMEEWRRKRFEWQQLKFAQGEANKWARERAQLLVSEWRELCIRNKECPEPPPVT